MGYEVRSHDNYFCWPLLNQHSLKLFAQHSLFGFTNICYQVESEIKGNSSMIHYYENICPNDSTNCFNSTIKYWMFFSVEHLFVGDIIVTRDEIWMLYKLN